MPIVIKPRIMHDCLQGKHQTVDSPESMLHVTEEALGGSYYSPTEDSRLPGSLSGIASSYTYISCGTASELTGRILFPSWVA